MGMQSGPKRTPAPAPPRCPSPDAGGKQPFYNIYHTVQREKRGQVVYNLAVEKWEAARLNFFEIGAKLLKNPADM